MNKKIILLLKMFTLSIGLIAVCVLLSKKINTSQVDDGSGSITRYDFAMGTSISVNLYDRDSDVSRLADMIFADIKSLDNTISWRSADSELGQMNQNYVASVPYQVDDILYTAVSQSLEICRDSDGALDITIRPLADTWNIETADADSFEVPDENEIRESLKYVDYRKIAVDGQNSDEELYITIYGEDMVIDLGAVGKGYALDCAKYILTDEDVDGAAISVGGSIMIYGSKADKSNWKVGIRNPEGDIDDMIGYLEFPPGTVTCISTSGDYEKFFEVDGIRYHHILDSSTGYPSASGLSGVTVVCENGLVSDALSTACFILGYERSLPLLEKYNAEAVFIDSDNKIIVTDGLKSLFSEQ